MLLEAIAKVFLDFSLSQKRLRGTSSTIHRKVGKWGAKEQINQII